MPLFTRFKFSLCSSKWLHPQNSLSICKRFESKTHYETLQLPQGCSHEDIRNKFLMLSKKFHPDRHLNDPTMHDRFILINEAYSILINPLTRRAYDISLQQKKRLGTLSAERQHTYAKSSSSAKTYERYSHGDPFTFHYQTGKNNEKREEETYYGMKGVKKVSNNRVATIVLLVTFFAVAIQLLTIRHSFIKSKEEILERSRKNAILNSMAKEKARLYGKEYQLVLLKRALDGSFDQETRQSNPTVRNRNVGDINANSILQSSQKSNLPPVSLAEAQPIGNCQKCNKCKHI